MRQLKAFMKAKKGVCSKKCECLTINMWRCADLQNDYEFCGCDETKTADMDKAILAWFKNSPVYKSLTDEEKEQALADAQEIIEGAGDGIAPFYQAIKKGKTFAVFAREMGLDVDESGTCDSTIYEDEEAFIIYVSAAGTIDCKHLALVARRGRTPSQELVNKDAISDYLDWVTTSSVTYQFKDWDDEILKVGTVEKGQTPVAPTDLPERPNYRFTGWSPSISAINYDTTYIAQYEEIIPVPVESVYVSPGAEVKLCSLGSGTFDFAYSPENADDFSGLDVVLDSYDTLVTTSTTYLGGTARTTVTSTADEIGSGNLNVMLDGSEAGSVDFYVNAPYVIEINAEHGTVSQSSVTACGGYVDFVTEGNTIKFLAEGCYEVAEITATPDAGYVLDCWECRRPSYDTECVESGMLDDNRDTIYFTAKFYRPVPVENIVVQGTAGSYGVPVEVPLGGTATINCTYSPANANVFSDVILEYRSYDEGVASMSVVPNGDGTGSVVLHGDSEGRGVADIKIGEDYCSPGLDISVVKDTYTWDVTYDDQYGGTGSFSPNIITVNRNATYHCDLSNNTLTFTYNGVAQTITVVPDAGCVLDGFITDDDYALTDGTVRDIPGVEYVSAISILIGGEEPSYPDSYDSYD